MPDNYNGETLVLPDIDPVAEAPAGNELYIFAVHDGRIERFPLTGTVRLGRMTGSNKPEIAIQNMFLSRAHGYFTVSDGKASYTAEETTNGISLNGKVVPAGLTVPLNDGDELTIPIDRSAEKDKEILLKCAFSPRNISLWSSMTEAQLDELTGLPGRRLFSERFRTYHVSGSKDWFFILDIDKFKQINDIYGHSAGDEALKALAEELSKPDYSISFPTRWGGDEFVGIISGSKENVIRNLDLLIDSLSSRMINNSFFIFISVGLCEMPGSGGGKELSVILEKADKALYHAKRSGGTEKICFCE
jgi:diguanylate cyclase (GGDEF)-like protein